MRHPQRVPPSSEVRQRKLASRSRPATMACGLALVVASTVVTLAAPVACLPCAVDSEVCCHMYVAVDLSPVQCLTNQSFCSLSLHPSPQRRQFYQAANIAWMF